MKDKLYNLLTNSYSPYSNFRVSAIVVTKDKKEYTGINVENASYGASICAERTAILKAVSEGNKKGNFDKLYVMVDSDKISSCCFACRQVITEFYEPNDEIILYNKLGDSITYTVKELCPLPFTSEDL